MEAKSFEEVPTFKKLKVPQQIQDFLYQEHDVFLAKIKEENPLNLKSTEIEEQDYWLYGEIMFNTHTKELEIWLKAKQKIISYTK